MITLYKYFQNWDSNGPNMVCVDALLCTMMFNNVSVPTMPTLSRVVFGKQYPHIIL